MRITNAPREYTTDEVRTKLLEHIKDLVDYWATNGPDDVHGKLDGLAFSILATLDGESGDMPAFVVAPDPHPDDYKYRKGLGENWFPINHDRWVNCDLSGSLHEYYAGMGKEK